MFGRAKLYERLLNEKDTHLRILVAEIDWLRAQLGRPSLPATIQTGPATTGHIPPDTPSSLDDGGWVSEAEEAEKILEERGLSRIHLPEILDGLGYGNSTLS